MKTSEENLKLRDFKFIKTRWILETKTHFLDHTHKLKLASKLQFGVAKLFFFSFTQSFLSYSSVHDHETFQKLFFLNLRWTQAKVMNVIGISGRKPPADLHCLWIALYKSTVSNFQGIYRTSVCYQPVRNIIFTETTWTKWICYTSTLDFFAGSFTQFKQENTQSLANSYCGKCIKYMWTFKDHSSFKLFYYFNKKRTEITLVK